MSKQVKMKSFEFTEPDYELGAIAVERLSALMRAERAAKGRSIRTLARKLKIKRKHIKNWEAGKSCPPGPTMMAIFAHYGKEPLNRLSKLDLELQHMKYQRTLQRIAALANTKKIPAVIWAEKEQFLLAA